VVWRRSVVASALDLTSGGELSVTITTGATLARPDDDPAGLLQRADKLLYRGKCVGRDRVMMDAT
jgi:PleD family two-component response regulator